MRIDFAGNKSDLSRVFTALLNGETVTIENNAVGAPDVEFSFEECEDTLVVDISDE